MPWGGLETSDERSYRRSSAQLARINKHKPPTTSDAFIAILWVLSSVTWLVLLLYSQIL